MTFLLYHHIGCVLEFRCGCVGVVSVWQAEAQGVLHPATRIPPQLNRRSFAITAHTTSTF